MSAEREDISVISYQDAQTQDGGPARRRQPPRKPAVSDGGYRPELQGLRAVAVSLVVVYHLYPRLLPGGYVGVDVFFVISGFLITSHLAKTMATRGRVLLLDFYGRRARRLMPAAALVLAVTWLASLRILPATRLPATADQVRASALYFQNWVLAHNAVTYLTSDDAPSPVQHFWSLSVEEQFYLIWPVLFLVATIVGFLLGRRRGIVATDVAARAMLALAFVVVVASLWYSARETASNPAAAYFVTTTRIWELGLGGLLAMAPASLVQRWSRVGPVGWVGLALIVASAFLIDSGSAFPGTVALLPTMGATLLIACGPLSAPYSPGRLLSWAPMVFLGDISYSLYLWHWPIIVLWKARTGSHIGLLDGPALAAGSVLLAWGTKVFVEDTFRRNRFVTRNALSSLATVAVLVVPVGLVVGWTADQPPSVGALTPVSTVDPNYPGAASLAHDAPPVPNKEPRPSLVQASHDYGAYGKGPGGCQTAEDSSAETPCRFGDQTDPTKTVYILGDSVSAEFFDDLNALAKKKRWLLVTDLHSLCPWTATMARIPVRGGDYTACHDWGERALTRVLAAKPAMVITSARPTVGVPDQPRVGRKSFAEIGAGMAVYWKQLLAHGIAVTAIRETPEMGSNVPDCLSRPGAKPADCSVSEARAVIHNSPLQVATSLTPGASLIDLTRYFCRAKTCDAVIGNIVVYIDSHHVTTTYASTVAPYLYKRLLELPALR